MHVRSDHVIPVVALATMMAWLILTVVEIGNKL